MKKLLFVGCFTAVGLGVAVVSAAVAGERPRQFEKIDANGDGAVTFEEMSARQAQMFAKMDGDGDGVISSEEMAVFSNARRDEMRERMDPDQNGDGVIDRAEYDAMTEKRFQRLDKNGDGVLSEAEKPKRRGFGGRDRSRK